MKDDKRGHLCCVIQGEEIIKKYGILNYYQNNRYYPGLTGAVVLCEQHILLILEGPSQVIVDKFMDLTSTNKTFIQVISTGPFVFGERLFDTLEFALWTKTDHGRKLVTEHNQEVPSVIRNIMNESANGHPLKKFIKSFLLLGHMSYNYKGLHD